MLVENRKVSNPRLIKFDDVSIGTLLAKVDANKTSVLRDAKDYADTGDSKTLKDAKDYTDEKKGQIDESIGTLASDSLKILTTAELTSAVSAMANSSSFFYLDLETRTLGKKVKDSEGQVTDTVIGKLATE